MRVQIAAQATEQLELMLSKQIYHFDLKPSNLLVRRIAGRPLEVSLTDFGRAMRLKRKKPAMVVYPDHGTPHYASPETAKHLIDDKDFSSEYPTDSQSRQHKFLSQAEVYSMGLTLYYLRSGETNEGCEANYNGVAYNEEDDSILEAVSKVNSRDDLCLACGIFCNPDPTQKGKAAPEPPKNTLDYILYRMLDPSSSTRITAGDAARELKSLVRAQ
jgi:serine/threonine protein kinase